MKRSDYDDIINRLGNPDTVAEALVELDAKLQADESDYSKVQESVNTVRDINAKLALRLTAPVKTETEPEAKEPTYEDMLRQAQDAWNKKEDE